jgi:hypothetical protein
MSWDAIHAIRALPVGALIVRERDREVRVTAKIKLLLFDIASRDGNGNATGNRDGCTASYATLGVEGGMSARSVDRAIRALRKAEWITVTRRGPRANSIRVNGQKIRHSYVADHSGEKIRQNEANDPPPMDGGQKPKAHGARPDADQAARPSRAPKRKKLQKGNAPQSDGSTRVLASRANPVAAVLPEPESKPSPPHLFLVPDTTNPRVAAAIEAAMPSRPPQPPDAKARVEQALARFNASNAEARLDDITKRGTRSRQQPRDFVFWRGEVIDLRGMSLPERAAWEFAEKNPNPKIVSPEQIERERHAARIAEAERGPDDGEPKTVR